MRAWTAIAAGLAGLATACGGHAVQRAGAPASPGDGRPAQQRPGGERPAPALDLTTRMPGAYRRVCTRQRAVAPPRAQTCPPLIPAGPPKVIAAGPIRSLGAYSVDIASPSIGTLNGARIDANGGRWHYDAAWTPAARRQWVKRRIEHPQHGPRSRCRGLSLAAERIQACRVAPSEQGGGRHGGNIAYVWDHAGATYAISLHGYANEPRVQAMMAALIERVRAG